MTTQTCVSCSKQAVRGEKELVANNLKLTRQLTAEKKRTTPAPAVDADAEGIAARVVKKLKTRFDALGKSAAQAVEAQLSAVLDATVSKYTSEEATTVLKISEGFVNQQLRLSEQFRKEQGASYDKHLTRMTQQQDKFYELGKHLSFTANVNNVPSAIESAMDKMAFERKSDIWTFDSLNELQDHLATFRGDGEFDLNKKEQSAVSPGAVEKEAMPLCYYRAGGYYCIARCMTSASGQSARPGFTCASPFLTSFIIISFQNVFPDNSVRLLII